MSLFEKAEMHQVLFVTRMAVMGFVRATCSRGGSVCKDWFDRAGKMVYWLTRNVLSVSDFVWAKEGMELELPDGSTEMDPLRGEVKLKRVKHHYHEAGYEYDMSVTADAVQAARRRRAVQAGGSFCTTVLPRVVQGAVRGDVAEVHRGGVARSLGERILRHHAAGRADLGIGRARSMVQVRSYNYNCILDRMHFGGRTAVWEKKVSMNLVKNAKKGSWA